MITGKKICTVMVPLLLLAGCGLSKDLGLEREPIDEFSVIRRAPLSLPPNYDMRPPEPGAPRPQETAVRDLAEEAVLGQGNQGALPTDRTLTEGESILLRQAGADKADQDIRERLRQDEINRRTKKEEEGFFDFNIDKYNPFLDDKDKDNVIDPKKEAERLESQDGEAVDDATSAPDENEESSDDAGDEPLAVEQE